MRKFHQLFTSFLVLSALFLAGCDKKGPEPTRYTVTFKVKELSDDLFALGTFSAIYADKDGKEQKMDIDKASMPFEIIVNDLKEDSRLFFRLAYNYSADAELTKEKYVFKYAVSMILKDLSGSVEFPLSDDTYQVSKDNLKTYFASSDESTADLSTTIKQFLLGNWTL